MNELLLQISETITQALAFLIFFWVMKKFAWPALTAVLDERQRKIEEGFASIEQKQAETDRLHKEYAEHLRNIEAEARQKIQEAVADGRRVAAEVTEAARVEAQKITERAQRNMEIELDKARVELREEIINMTLGAAERLLREKLDEPAQRRQVALFIQDLERKN